MALALRRRRETVLMVIVGVMALVLILLWVRPAYSPFYAALLPYDIRDDIKTGQDDRVMDALHSVIFLLGQANAMPALLETDMWHERWRRQWSVVFEASQGGLQDVSIICLRFGETRLTADLMRCVEQAQALRE